MSRQYKVETPDGKTLTIEGPEDATDDEIVSFVDQHLRAEGSKFAGLPNHVNHPEASKPPPAPNTLAGLVAAGSGAPVQPQVDRTGAALYGLGDGVTLGALDEIGSALDSIAPGDAPSIWNGHSFSDAYDANLARNRGILHAAQDQHPVLYGAGEIGSLAIPTGAAKVLQLTNLLSKAPRLGRAAVEAGQGAVYGFNSGEGDVQDRIENAVVGGVTGAATGAVLRAGGRLVSPVVRPAVQKLRDAGVPLTIGQIKGGMARDIEDKMMSIPALGDLIKANRREGVEAYQRAQINTALDPIKAKLPADVPVGRDAVEWAQAQASKAYDDALTTMRVRPDAPFASGMANVRSGVNSLAKDQVEDFDRVLQRHGAPYVGDPMDGRQIQSIKIGLNGQIARYRKGSPRDQDVADALEQVRDEFMGLASRQAPAEATAYHNADAAYANMVPVNRAAAKATKDGVPSPGQFSQAVREADRSVGKRAFARGDARLQELADAGAEVLPATVPDSGTPGRLILNSVAAGGIGSLGFLNPAAAVPAIAAAVPYLPGGRQAAQWVLTGRQNAAAQKARAILEKLSFPAALLAARASVTQPGE